jgi:hypothetical protein
LAKAVYILREVKENIEGCGGDSQIHLFKNDGTSDGLAEGEIAEIEKLFVRFNEVLRQSFDAAFDMGNVRPSPSAIADELNAIRAAYQWILNNRKQIRNESLMDYLSLRKRLQ